MPGKMVGRSVTRQDTMFDGAKKREQSRRRNLQSGSAFKNHLANRIGNCQSFFFLRNEMLKVLSSKLKTIEP